MANAKVGETFLRAEADPPEITRGSGLEGLFAARCRSVVLVVNLQGSGDGTKVMRTGTGSIVTMDGHILTASHVIEGNAAVAVGVFPNCKPGATPDFYAVDVVRNDTATDLALLQFRQLPSDMSIMPLGSLEEIRTGSPVVIIGHPRGLLMSLSQGTVSAIRPDFSWSNQNRATVIQTDGAINPGNSGGPMMSADGNLIGVNSFIVGKASAGLNFAVSVTDARNFLAGKTAAPARTASYESNSEASSCKPKVLKEWRSKDGQATMRAVDTECKGKIDFVLIDFDDKNKPRILAHDRNDDGEIDLYYTLDKNNKPEESLWDDNFDGKFEYKGYHVNGSWEPSRKARL
ncbi:MAG: serine protease [Gallionellaceae bacterium]|nr:serine protease [Gallionellaceae bacterium]